MTTDPSTSRPHYIDLVVEDGYVQRQFRCTATPDAWCRRRPPRAENHETWTDAEETEPGHECWAAEWVEAVGFHDAIRGEDDGPLASVPVTFGGDEGVNVAPVPAHPPLFEPDHLAAQEPTDAEVRAAADAILAHEGETEETAHGDLYYAAWDHARAALTAAKEARA